MNWNWLARSRSRKANSRYSYRPRIEQLETRQLLAVFSVVTTADSGPGSLRQAILDANANPGADIIHFQIPGSGVQTISPASVLPTITDPVLLDGTSQPGFSGTPVIELNGSAAGSNASGLVITAGSSTVQGLVINRFSADGIDLQTNGGSVIEGNFIGTDASGTVALANSGNGVLVTAGSHDNTIGGLTGTPGTGAGNVISGNQLNGVFLDAAAGSNTLIEGNLIGLDSSGSTAVANAGAGAFINSGQRTRIGGAAPRARNVISGNTNGIILSASGSNFGIVIQGNYIGTDITGSLARGNSNDGVGIGSAPGTLLGGSVAGAGNVISGNASAGVEISGISSPVISGLYNSLVQGNIIGLNASGTAALGNVTGVVVENSSNLIGGASAGAGNVISGNAGDGIVITSSGATANLVQGNYLGTEVTGHAALGNDGSGVHITNGANSNLIGGPTSTPGTGAGNVISGNQLDGVFLDTLAGSNTVIQGNLVGLDASGNNLVGNAGAGVFVNAGFGTLIGGAASRARNVISGNTNGIILSTSGSNFAIVIQGNYIGTDITGSLARGNSNDGVGIGSAPGTVLGGSIAGAGNVISSNASAGVEISGISSPVISGLYNSLVQGNIIGLNASGTAALGNVTGVVVENSSNLIGGASAGAGNVISGNTGDGIVITSSAATANLVQGDYLGTNITGHAALGNDGSGVHITAGANGNLIGGPTSTPGTGAGNVISGNQLNGVFLDTLAGSNTVILGNLVGLDASGTTVIANAGAGVFVNAGLGTLIGGTSSQARNVISGNANGIILSTSGSNFGIVIQGNYIGTDVTGSLARGNAGDGIEIGSAPGTILGGTVPGAGNVISGNAVAGVVIDNISHPVIGGQYNSVVQGNIIGLNAAATAALGNGTGVSIANSNNLIGGLSGGGNTIAGNLSTGVVVVSGTANAILSNSIFDNGGLGIDLYPLGVTLNDPGDADTGANDLQNFPVLSSAVTSGSTISITGRLNSTAKSSFLVQFFANTSCDPSGYGEGAVLLGSMQVTTDVSGNVTFSVSFVASVPAGDFITATATLMSAGVPTDTSEFSQCLLVTSGSST